MPTPHTFSLSTSDLSSLLSALRCATNAERRYAETCASHDVGPSLRRARIYDSLHILLAESLAVPLPSRTPLSPEVHTWTPHSQSSPATPPAPSVPSTPGPAQ